MEKKIVRCSNIGIGIAIIVCIFSFMGYFIYLNEPIGDDVISYFDSSITYYLDDYESNIGNRITSFNQIFSKLSFEWFHWTGRMPGYFLEYVGKLISPFWQAMISSLIYCSVIILSLNLVYNKIGDVFRHPISILIMFFALYWYRPYVYTTYMWIMTAIYSFSVLLALLYMNLNEKLQKKKYNTCKIVLFEMLGFIVGWSHEVVALILIMTICIYWIQGLIEGRNKLQSVFLHSGLGLGYCVGFFSPGNFYRMKQSHDVITNSYYDRLRYCFNQHVHTIFGCNFSKVMVSILLVMVIMRFLLIKKEGKNLVKKIMLYFIPAVISVFVWAITSKCPPYGMDMWIIYIYISILSVLYYGEKELFQNCCIRDVVAVICIGLFVFCNWNELKSFSYMSKYRLNLIENAKDNNCSEVLIPSYDEKVMSADRYSFDSLNNQKEYDKEYYCEYYGIHIIIDGQTN